MIGKEYVSRNDCFFRYRGPTFESYSSRDSTFIHLSTTGESRVLGMLRNHAIKDLDILERTSHENWIRDTMTIITEDSNARS